MGEDDDFGSYLVDMLPHGGRGGMPELDGMVPVAYPENSTITPCEVIEARAPVLFHKKELRLDSAGPGRSRGGPGQVIVFESRSSKSMVFNLTPDRITTEPQGLAGGKAGRMGEVHINGQRIERFPPLQLQPGDVVELYLPGGGGFGPVRQRDPASITRDLSLGYISAQQAQLDYDLEKTFGYGDY
jgi:N-methylhydantoinase B